MAVAYDAGSESHTGTSGSASEASFSWTHTPVGTPHGVLVFVMQDNSGTDKISSVTYGGTTVPAVSGGLAAKTSGSARLCKAFFLGSYLAIPTGAQSVVVNRTNDTTVMYAVAFTVTAPTGTEVYTPGIVLQNTSSTLAEQSVTDGASISNSVRFAGMSRAANAVPSAGASSTAGPSIDLGSHIAGTVRETTAGQGSRSIGWSSGTSADNAIVNLAVRELDFTTTVSPGAIALAGSAVAVTNTISVTHGAITVTGSSPILSGSTVFLVDAASSDIWDSETSDWDALVTSWDGTRVGNILFTGQSIALSRSLAVTHGAITLTGQGIALSRRTSLTSGTLALAGSNSVTSGATTFLVDTSITALTLAGASVSVTSALSTSPGAVTLAGSTVLAYSSFFTVDVTVTGITLAGRTIVISTPVAIIPPPSNIQPAPELHALHKLRKHYGLVRN